ncbi:hypothetical protein [Lacipirellula sp.]|uniref:hypothetical protein n=1 Tax=Lacipirellula sp. TaxID=2691419 RepID=UPI003D098578
MGYTIFAVGDRVRIKSGDFGGIEGVISDPTAAHDAVGTVNARRQSMLLPLTVVAQVEGRKMIIRVAAEMLERVVSD